MNTVEQNKNLHNNQSLNEYHKSMNERKRRNIHVHHIKTRVGI